MVSVATVSHVIFLFISLCFGQFWCTMRQDVKWRNVGVKQRIGLDGMSTSNYFPVSVIATTSQRHGTNMASVMVFLTILNALVSPQAFGGLIKVSLRILELDVKISVNRSKQ